MIDIIPAIMPFNIDELENKLSLVASYVPLVQLDVMDGRFVGKKCWPYVGDDGSFDRITAQEAGLPYWENLNYEIDLMVDKPEDVIEKWIAAGASRIVVHIESTKQMEKIVKEVAERFAFPGDKKPIDVELGIALNPNTATTTILSYLENINFVQFMGIDKIGYQGQPFNENIIEKINVFHDAHPEIMISVDGGVDAENAHALVEAGAKRLIIGSKIFENDDVAGNIEIFENLLNG